jgi:hypothetical protein
MGPEEFDRRWSASGRWMLIVVPGTAPATAESPSASAASATPPEGECDVLVAEGVRAAQENQLDAAERTLVSALGCPGAAAFRELAGVRLLQQRWADVTAAAETAVRIAPDDTHAWKLLGAGRYLQDERLRALEAWNHAGEPRVDLVRIDNLSRTRHRVVERSIGVEAGEVLTTASFRRAQRRLSEVPAFAAARLQFQPVPEGQVELQGAVTERQLLPGSAFSWAVFGMTTAAVREVRLAAASPTGGGEALTVGWRFHPNRPRVTLGLLAPTPWGGGVWGAMAAVERQEFDTEGAVAARRATALATLSDWVSSSVRWELRGGVDRWRDLGRFATAGGALTLIALDDRARAVLRGAGWFGSERFATGELQFNVLSSRTRRGFVASISGAAQLASEVTPLDLWFGGDTGLARQPALRAHPMLDGGRLRVERLGRSFVGLTAEAQHWWPQTGRLQTAAALFVDTGRTALRAGLHPRTDADVGLGVRFGVVGVSGTFRADVAKGLRDGATALSFFYTP